MNSINLQNTILNQEFKEIFCPLCETIGNSLLLVDDGTTLGLIGDDSQAIKNEKNLFTSFNNWFQMFKQSYCEKNKNGIN
jgi:hypothetical protein